MGRCCREHTCRLCSNSCEPNSHGLSPHLYAVPGEFLAETLTESGSSHVVNSTRPVTAELALLFGRALGLSPQYWLSLQTAYDLKKTEVAISKQLLAVTKVAPA